MPQMPKAARRRTSMTKEALKAQCLEYIDARKEEIIAIGQEIFAHPELGFKETHTAAVVRRTLDDLNISCR